MHNLFYGIGGISMLPAGYLIYRSIEGGGVAPLQWSLYVFIGAILLLGIGRGLELMERLADALAPQPNLPKEDVNRSAETPQRRAIGRGL